MSLHTCKIPLSGITTAKPNKCPTQIDEADGFDIHTVCQIVDLNLHKQIKMLYA